MTTLRMVFKDCRTVTIFDPADFRRCPRRIRLSKRSGVYACNHFTDLRHK
jgi:hypothetical protein